MYLLKNVGVRYVLTVDVRMLSYSSTELKWFSSFDSTRAKSQVRLHHISDERTVLCMYVRKIDESLPNPCICNYMLRTIYESVPQQKEARKLHAIPLYGHARVSCRFEICVLEISLRQTLSEFYSMVVQYLCTYW